jgi:hypothetical protein
MPPTPTRTGPSRYDRIGFRPTEIGGVKFETWLQGGLDDCCSLYAVVNAFSYLFARYQREILGPSEESGGFELLRHDDWLFWKKLRSHRFVREHIANAYVGGAYPRDVEELARFVNEEIFGERYRVERIDDHGSFVASQKALCALGAQKSAVHLVLIKEDKADTVGHWIVLVHDEQSPPGYQDVIDSNRGYRRWKLDERPLRLLISREYSSEFDRINEYIKIYEVQSTISISINSTLQYINNILY